MCSLHTFNIGTNPNCGGVQWAPIVSYRMGHLSYRRGYQRVILAGTESPPEYYIVSALNQYNEVILG